MFITVKVPGTTANLGAGFDCIGAALTIYNQFTFTLLENPTASVQIEVKGTEAERVSRDESNLAYRAFAKLYEHIGKTIPAIALEIDLGIPMARGLGSSATAIVGGLVGANHLAGTPLDPSEVMELAIALEGHPDNVVPAFLGNCQLSIAVGNQWEICPIPWHSAIAPVVAIPNFELSTEEARSVLPQQISRSDAIFNISRLGLLLRGLDENNANWLRAALDDKLHQPYRKSLIRGYEAVEAAAIASGAYGMVISGAGPTLLALAETQQAEGVAAAMKTAWESLEIVANTFTLTLDKQGAKQSLKR
ncbi:homoserine kinase [Lusitaniella coriacea LEGE 07157]|uniref:Homoserine kinase n=1 Tax=Lusitaniella coriacea LEGE 07157 TaxID=945747 RepID=A0A8J7DZ10_9CYAN|nr:homoserine kinase [Lusitaniella coriacea]MBE9116381.1 homoserine kinase [Lusitaniella coriacea LEGE 07157]